MQYQILVQQPSDQRFTASVMGLASVVADGETEEEVIANIKAALASQLAATKVVTIELEDERERTEENDPWIKYAGIFADDPTFDEFLEDVAAFRRQADDEARA